jgi:uncharacterized protein YdhG (YjbR/CyaY superfamily)
MATTSSLAAYMAALPPDVRRQVRRMRTTLRAVAPGAVDVISYGIPALRFDGKVLLWYAGWKNHTSLYPLTPAVRRALGSAISGYATSKGTIRFPLDDPPTEALLRKMARARVAEVRSK